MLLAEHTQPLTKQVLILTREYLPKNQITRYSITFNRILIVNSKKTRHIHDNLLLNKQKFQISKRSNYETSRIERISNDALYFKKDSASFTATPE